jgi:hypothetical protein
MKVVALKRVDSHEPYYTTGNSHFAVAQYPHSLDAGSAETTGTSKDPT